MELDLHNYKLSLEKSGKYKQETINVMLRRIASISEPARTWSGIFSEIEKGYLDGSFSKGYYHSLKTDMNAYISFLDEDRRRKEIHCTVVSPVVDKDDSFLNKLSAYLSVAIKIVIYVGLLYTFGYFILRSL